MRARLCQRECAYLRRILASIVVLNLIAYNLVLDVVHQIVGSGIEFVIYPDEPVVLLDHLLSQIVV